MDSTTNNKDKIKRIKQWLGTGSINLFGLPFAGKDTHGHKLAEWLEGVIISGGDIIRNSKQHQHVHEKVKGGALAPQDEYLRIVLPYFEREELRGKPLILSAVGRWYGEETGIMQAAQASDHPLKAVILLQITEDDLWQRWQAAKELGDRGSRHDDAESAIQTRIDEYNAKTLPVIDFYKQEGLLINIDGTMPKSAVSDEIINQLHARATAE